MKKIIATQYRGKLPSTLKDLNKLNRRNDSGIYELKIPVASTILNLPPNEITFTNNEYIGLTPSSFLTLFKNKGTNISVENNKIKIIPGSPDNSNYLTGILEVVSDDDLCIQKFHRLPDGSLWDRSYDYTTNTWTKWSAEIPSYIKNDELSEAGSLDSFTDKNNNLIKRNNYMGSYRGDGKEVNNTYTPFNLYNKFRGTLTDLEVVDYLDKYMVNAEKPGGIAYPDDQDNNGSETIRFRGVPFRDHHYITYTEFSRRVAKKFDSNIANGEEQFNGGDGEWNETEYYKFQNEKNKKMGLRNLLLGIYFLKNNYITQSRHNQVKLLGDTLLKPDTIMIGKNNTIFRIKSDVEGRLKKYYNKIYQFNKDIDEALLNSFDRNTDNVITGGSTPSYDEIINRYPGIHSGSIIEINSANGNNWLNLVLEGNDIEILGTSKPYVLSNADNTIIGQMDTYYSHLGKTLGSKKKENNTVLEWDIPNSSIVEDLIRNKKRISDVKFNSDEFPNSNFLIDILNLIRVCIYKVEKKKYPVSKNSVVYTEEYFVHDHITEHEEFYIIPYEYVNDKFMNLNMLGISLDENNNYIYKGIKYDYIKGDNKLSDKLKLYPIQEDEKYTYIYEVIVE